MKLKRCFLGIGGLLASILIAGCSDPQAKRLHGEWGIASANHLSKRLGQSAEENSETESPEERETPRMRLYFQSSGKLRTITEIGKVAPIPKEGRWRLLSFDESSQRMQIECTLGQQTTEHEVRFVDPDTIELVPPNMAGTEVKVKFERIQ